MNSQAARVSSLLQWTFSPSTTPSVISTTTIDPADASAVSASLSKAVEILITATGRADLISNSRVARGAKASLDVISAQQVLATATNSEAVASASAVIDNNVLNLQDLLLEKSLYEYFLKPAPNILFLVIFTIIFLFNTLMVIRSRYYWYNITYFCGYGLEFCGWLGRVLSIPKEKTALKETYILQFIALTLAPAFIMAGIYFLFAQIVVIHGRQYSVLKPLWYSYLFITIDVLSLLVQAGGGGAASTASNNQRDPTPGTNTVIAGLAVQVVGMTIFIGFWFEFLNRLYFRNRNQVEGDSPYKKRSFVNFFKLLFNTKSAAAYKNEQLDQFHNPRYAHIRSRKLFGYFPLVMTVSVIVIYTRCVYRVVELSEGWSGYLMTTEVYLFVLDAVMIAIAGLLSIPFHPVFVFGKDNVVKLAHIKRNIDEKDSDADETSSVSEPQNDPEIQSQSYDQHQVTEKSTTLS